MRTTHYHYYPFHVKTNAHDEQIKNHIKLFFYTTQTFYIFYPIVCKWLSVNVTHWAFKLLSYSIGPVWRVGLTARSTCTYSKLFDSHPRVWCWMSHPENVKKERKKYVPSGEAAIDTQDVWGLIFAALRWPMCAEARNEHSSLPGCRLKEKEWTCF